MDKQEELLTANLVYPIIKDLILPKIQRFIKNFSDDETLRPNLENIFQNYLSKRYEKYLVIDTLAFPNKQTSFDILYEPLSLISYDENKETVEIKIDCYPDNLLSKYFRVIIEDTAGMGKSTIVKKLFLSSIIEKKGIPIIIELRQINEINTIAKEIQNQFSPLNFQISSDVISQMIEDGEFIFLFDGFDEISKNDKEFVIKELHNFIEKANNNYFLITSRPEDSLTSFGDFKKFSVRPMYENEAFSLIKRYDYYAYMKISDLLIQKISNSEEKTLKEFLTNPFLVSLLYKSFDFKKDIPLKKSQFYRQVYDSLFEAHDLSKEGYLKREKNSNLHTDDFEKVLRYFGYFSAIENKVEYDKNYVLNLIEKVKIYLPDFKFKSSDFLKDLLETVPLFKKEGNYIKWAHKSIQDYFAAKFIWLDSDTEQKDILKKIFDDKENYRFYNILDLLYELEPSLFNKTILFWLLQDFFDYCDNHYNEITNIDSIIMAQRKSNSYHKKCSIVVSKKEDYEVIQKGGLNSREIRDYYNKQVKQKYVKTNYNYFTTPKVVVLTFIDVDVRIDNLLKLISFKIPELAALEEHPVHLEELKLLKENIVYFLTDEKDNILNDENIFELVNDLILSEYTLKYDNALIKYNQIREYINIDKKSHFTNW